MLNKRNFLSNINPSVRLLILMLFIAILIIAKSLYLISLMVIVLLIFSIFLDLKVNQYVKFAKKHILLLSFLLLAYIILLSNYSILNITIFTLKIIIIILYIYIFEFSIDFDQMHEAVYGILLPIKLFNVQEVSKDLTFSLCFIKYWFDFREQKDTIQTSISRKMLFSNLSFKSNFNYAICKLGELQLRLELNFYKLKYKKLNTKSKLYLILSILFFVICLFKEVLF